MSLNLDFRMDEKFTEQALTILRDRYLLPEEKSPQQALGRVAEAFSDSEYMAEKIYDYVSKQWFMFATPVLTNGGTKRGMPISCFLNYVPDSREGLTEHYTENAWLASVGGGIGGYWGDIRSDGIATSGGSQSSGSIPFMHVVDSEEFLDMRKPSGGDIHRKCLNLHHGVCIPDSFMSLIDKCSKDNSADDSWQLVDPHTNNVVKTVSAKQLWQKILENRVATGEPYLFFTDTVNQALPEAQQIRGLTVKASNLCSEITLPTDKERTAVCCLSSVNLEYFDEWKHDPEFIYYIVRFLDNVLEHFIDNAPPDLYKAVWSAEQERSIGLGAMGFHAYLQRNMIPFNTVLSVTANNNIFKHIKEEAVKASLELGKTRGEAPDMIGTGRRNAHLLAIAPNATSSILCNTSPSIEPLRANAFVAKTMSGSFLYKNKYLREILKQKNIDNDETWKSIIANKGSVQHLKDLGTWEQDVFATAIEIDQRWIVDLAAQRQEYICQSQSLNLFVPADVHIKDLHEYHMRAWKKGVKTLYYCRSEAIRRAEILSTKVERKVRPDYKTEEECLSCEG
jgi:ribonucleoside-diphosphate reductase alpha chain